MLFNTGKRSSTQSLLLGGQTSKWEAENVVVYVLRQKVLHESRAQQSKEQHSLNEVFPLNLGIANCGCFYCTRDHPIALLLRLKVISWPVGRAVPPPSSQHVIFEGSHDTRLEVLPAFHILSFWGFQIFRIMRHGMECRKA